MPDGDNLSKLRAEYNQKVSQSTRGTQAALAAGTYATSRLRPACDILLVS